MADSDREGSEGDKGLVSIGEFHKGDRSVGEKKENDKARNVALDHIEYHRQDSRLLSDDSADVGATGILATFFGDIHTMAICDDFCSRYASDQIGDDDCDEYE